jgi:hypothetical protein
LVVWRCAKQSALQKPEFLKLCLAPGDHPAGRIQVDVFVQQFELAERYPVAGVALLLGPSGTAAYLLRKRAIWPAKQQPFSSPKVFRRRFSI